MDAPPLMLGRACLQEASALPTPRAGVGSWQPVHRSLVHKRDGDQVVLREFRDDADGCLVFDVRDARTRLKSVLDDAGFVAETLRQSTIALAHLQHGVAGDWAFLMDRMSFRFHAGSLYSPPTTVRIRARDVVARAGNLHSLVSVFELLSDEHVIATGEGYLRVLSRGVYRRIRAGSASRQPARATLRSARPVTLCLDTVDASRCTMSWSASVDPEDPFFFDHEVDHLPGMAIYEAVCAVASLTSEANAPRVVAFDGSFHLFVELGEQLQLTAVTALPRARLGIPDSIDVEVSSNGRLVMSATVGVADTQATRSAD
ncbi:AfsA-related hotdog domain-containing protein [Microbacterium sp. GXF6406]